eukprot:544405-Pyramimonas_sp.AAC.1
MGYRQTYSGVSLLCPLTRKRAIRSQLQLIGLCAHACKCAYHVTHGNRAGQSESIIGVFHFTTWDHHAGATVRSGRPDHAGATARSGPWDQKHRSERTHRGPRA